MRQWPLTLDELAAIKPAAGMWVKPDGWHMGSVLEDSGDTFTAMRLPVNSGGPITSLAVRVEVTGRTRKLSELGAKLIRVRVTFPGDGEPDTVTYGWMQYERMS